MTTSSDNKAKAALVRALLKENAFDGKTLEITWPHDRETVKALIALMSDVTIEDWAATPMEGQAYRQYSGTLPSGLRLDIVTNLEDVAPIDCPLP